MPFAKSALHNSLLLAGMTAAALNAGPAHGLIVTETETFSFLTFLFATTTDSDSVGTTLTFDKFDPALGTLSQVDIELISRVTGNVSASGFGTGTVEASSELDIDLNVDVDGLLSPVFTLSTNFGGHCGPSSFSCFGFTPFNEAFNGLFSVPSGGGALASFTGALATFDVDLGGQYDLSCTAQQGTGCSSFASVSWRNLTALGEVKVTYTYEPVAVPEPASLALFGLGMAGLWLTRRKQAATSS